MKLFIDSLDNFILVIPNRGNYSDNKKEYMKDILSEISMVDYYLERCLKKKYITQREVNKKTTELLKITKMVYGWIRENESRSK